MKNNNMLVIGKDRDSAIKLIENMFMVEGNTLEIDDDIVVFKPDGFDIKIVFVEFKSKKGFKLKSKLLDSIFKRKKVDIVWKCIDNFSSKREVCWITKYIKFKWGKAKIMSVNCNTMSNRDYNRLYYQTATICNF